MRALSEAKSHTGVSDELDLACVGAGLFRMGGTRVACEGPVHEVQVLPFSIGRRPVSRAAYRRFLEENPSEPLPRFWGKSRWSEPEAPVVGVSWERSEEHTSELQSLRH